MKLRTKFLCFVEGGMLLGVLLLAMLLHRLASCELTTAAHRQSEPLVLCAAGRPCLALSAPVREGETVIAVQRVVVDLALFNRKWPAPLADGPGSRVAVPAADADLKPIVARLAGEPPSGVPYEPSDLPIPEAMLADASGFFRYPAHKGWRMAAYRRLDRPDWVLVAERPLDEVLAPVARLRRVLVGSSMGVAVFLAVGIFLIVRPTIRDLRECQRFAYDLRDGHLDRCLTVRRADEIGELACSLNDMAAGIARQHGDLEQAERKYRTIFENAVEGIQDVTEQHRAQREHERAIEAERLLAQSRWESMRYQINPHFLFNVLNTLDDLSRNAPERIPPMNLALARYLRLTLDPGEGRLFPLLRELEGVGAYLEIEQIRFAERLRVTWEIDSGARDFPTPELVLQPLVENAVKYGMRTTDGPLHRSCRVEDDRPLAGRSSGASFPAEHADSSFGDGAEHRPTGFPQQPLHIRIYARVDNQRLTLTVDNSGRWVPPAADRERPGVGLDNLRRRLDALYDGDFEMGAGPSCEGVRVWLRLRKDAVGDQRAGIAGSSDGTDVENGASFGPEAPA